MFSFEEMSAEAAAAWFRENLGEMVRITGKRQQEIIVELKEGICRKQLLERMLEDDLCAGIFR